MGDKTKIISQEILSGLSNKAIHSSRKRTHFNLHKEISDPVQRLIVAIEPGSYLRPHRHPEPDKWECFMVFSGSAVMLVFSEQGKILERTEIKNGGPVFCVEIPPGVWHTLAATSPGTILMEVKPGPYNPLSEENFAYWAPAENSEKCSRFERWFRTASVDKTPLES
jgi:cupin fold WbuC family metalloprotein